MKLNSRCRSWCNAPHCSHVERRSVEKSFDSSRCHSSPATSFRSQREPMEILDTASGLDTFGQRLNLTLSNIPNSIIGLHAIAAWAGSISSPGCNGRDGLAWILSSSRSSNKNEILTFVQCDHWNTFSICHDHQAIGKWKTANCWCPKRFPPHFHDVDSDAAKYPWWHLLPRWALWNYCHSLWISNWIRWWSFRHRLRCPPANVCMGMCTILDRWAYSSVAYSMLISNMPMVQLAASWNRRLDLVYGKIDGQCSMLIVSCASEHVMVLRSGLAPRCCE